MFLEKRNFVIFGCIVNLLDLIIAYLIGDFQVFTMVTVAIIFMIFLITLSPYTYNEDDAVKKKLFSMSVLAVSLPVLVFLSWVLVEKIFFNRVF